MMREIFAAAAELKFVGDPAAGQIEGYATVWNVIDRHGDSIVPGAFDATLAEHKANGTMPGMYGEHSYFMFGGDPYPVGEWTEMEPDTKGLHVKGNLIALEHPDVARLHKLLQKKVLKGLSIAWSGRGDGVERNKKAAAGEPKRYLRSIDLFSVDPVRDPANRLASVEAVKAMMSMPNTAAAAESLVHAHEMCLACMGGGDAPTTDERNQITGHIRTAYKHITGNDMPTSTKSKPGTIRELERSLRELGFSNSEARSIAERGFKTATPRDEDEAAARLKALGELRGALSGFTLPKLGD
jgi:hypothetical protein